MTLKFCTLDVFTDHRFGGNPLAVFVDVPELPADFLPALLRVRSDERGFGLHYALGATLYDPCKRQSAG